ncbi:MAG: SurA N-terminal domain-containing protein [Methylacidiphilales bacterium]|nr:SurA N-terminal domain-containing protein [Candidatus Methylacidiphilales bacterium]
MGKHFLLILGWFVLNSGLLSGQVVDGIAAVVNDDVITFSDVRKNADSAERGLREKYPADKGKLLEGVKAARIKALNDLIDRRLIIQEFKKNGFSVPESVVNERINRIVQDQFKGNWDELTKALKAQGVLYEEFRIDIKENTIVQAMRQKNVDMAARDELKALHLPIPITDGTPEQQEAYSKAKERKRLEWTAGLRTSAYIKAFF